ncbi:ABC transporter [Herminiimonas sp. KBW02]|uniref:ABC-type transport auxiliary lipoprotein family protein n=1 Tax=Herminiimonas sp. KBW02 TaxID=2153363 RepID=UPI000F5A0636|nr:ABC-type transport auxiliary lipoprotein family protein [Herminiimonas sp. KBW02]RQO34730.1 ABC transporter [Herminiimonas sp. KBW02]
MKLTRRLLLTLALAGSAVLTGCAGNASAPVLYDLGPLPAHATQNAKLPAISVADVVAPSWLDTPMMFYRLNYANGQQPRPYAGSQWAMPPAELLEQRLKVRLSQAGGIVVPADNGAANLPILRIELDDFSQSFDSAQHSTISIAMRASLFDGRTLRAQKTFSRQLPSASPNAQGGAAALATASDGIINEIAAWLSTVATKK